MADNCCNIPLSVEQTRNIRLEVSGDGFGTSYELPTMSSDIKGGAKLGDGLAVDENERLGIEDGGVSESKIGEGAVTSSKLASDVTDMIDGSVRAFDTVADMQAATDLEAGMIAHTNGFHASGDGGAAFYEITSSGTANGMDVLACGDVFANLVITESYVTPEMFGAVGDGIADDTAKIQAAFNSGLSVVFSNSYNCGTVNVSGINDARYSGAANSYFTGNVYITFTNCEGILLESLKFDSCTNSTRTVYLIDCDGVTFRNCAFSNLTNSAVQITRSTTTAISRNYLFDGCTFKNVNTTETWGGGIYWDGLGTNGSDGLPSKQISNVRVSDCVFENVGCAGVNSGGCVGLVITGNICDQNNASYTSTMGLVTTSRESADIVVENNIILHTKFEGVIFARSFNIVANGNYFYDCKIGIAIESAANRCICVGNRIFGGYTDGLLNTGVIGYGFLTFDSSDIKIHGNVVRDCYNGVYISYGTQEIDVSDNSIISNNSCVTGSTSTAEHQTIGVNVRNNYLKSNANISITAIMYSGVYAITGNIVESAPTASGMYLHRPYDTSNFEYHVSGNILGESVSAINISDTATNQTDGVVHYYIYDNDFSKCTTVFKKDADARILAFSYARNKKTMTAAELFGYFDRNSELEYNGTLAALLAETPGSQSMTYVRWQIGSVIKCNDSFIHITRAGNPSTGATLQYKEY